MSKANLSKKYQQPNFEELIAENYKPRHRDVILQALSLATSAHTGQKRDSGEEFVTHPMAVATILVELGMDYEAISAALLHDTLEDTKTTREELKEKFGENVLHIVEGVTKLSNLKFMSAEEEKAANIRKMLLSMTKDVRTIVVKLADRLHNLRTLEGKALASRQRIAKETLEIHVKIAARLGIMTLKGELEDICFRHLHDKEYHEIAAKVAKKLSERKAAVEKIIEKIKNRLDELGIPAEVHGRPKHFYSIFRKMQAGKHFDEIYDLLAVRIILDPSIDDEKHNHCYAILGEVHGLWNPLPGRVKDYIKGKKPNEYQSLHTAVMTNTAGVVEVQIRTYEMHKVAEYGIAAHWKYKEAGKSARVQASEIDKKLDWVRDVLENQHDLKDSSEFLDAFKVDLYDDSIFIFTPRGDIKTLPRGSTGIDFAYQLHSEIGNKYIGIKIGDGEGKKMPNSYQLQSGDIVHVLTNPNAKGPSLDWLKDAKTTSAKNKIRAFFKKGRREENVARGKYMLERVAKSHKTNLSALFSGKEWKGYIKERYNWNNIEDVFAAVGCGDLSAKGAVSKALEFVVKEIVPAEPVLKIKNETQSKNAKGDSVVVVDGQADFLIRLSQCCNPIPGDEIVGYVSRGRGVSVHRIDCPNMKNIEQERLIKTEWPHDANGKYVANITVYAENKTQLIHNVSKITTKMNVNITAMNARPLKDGEAIMVLSVELISNDLLELLKKSISAIKGVLRVTRT